MESEKEIQTIVCSFHRAVLFIIFINILNFVFPISSRASVISYKRTSDGVFFLLDKGSMKILVFGPDIIEVKYSVLDTMPARKSLVIIDDLKSRPEFTISEKKTEIEIKTNRLKISVNKATNAVTYCDTNEDLILAEDSLKGKSMTASVEAGIPTYTCATKYQSRNDEAFYGLGCHPEDTGSVNYKGRNQTLAIKYMTGGIPVLLSNKGYGLMWDNYSASKFYGAQDANKAFSYVSESGELVDYFFFYGPEFDKIISLYRHVTGTAPMFGKWAFGLFQSQDRYMSQQEVLSVKDNYRKNKIPVDCIVQDWFYWEPNVMGSHQMNIKRYPDPKSMVDELHKANIHAMISIWPLIAKGTPNYDELNQMGGLTDLTWRNFMTKTLDNYYDAHNEKARQVYWRQAKDQLVGKYNWDAWWVDSCEPDNGGLVDDRKKSKFAIGRGIDYFNTYALMHSTGLYSGWRKDIPGKRAFLLIRQAFAGAQRNAIALWSSDITCTFRALKSQVPQAINTCASGIPYWTSDIGGYHMNWKSPDWSKSENRELFTRWFQFGAFSPIFRIHGKGERAIFAEVWDDKTKDILLKYDNLRYRLMPYIYSLAWKVTSEDYTMMRSLAFDFRKDSNINAIQDQYMFGPAFLVNPVTDPMPANHSNAALYSRKVYLPKETKWYNFWNGKAIDGGQVIYAEAPIETMPLFIKAGSIIPMGPYIQYATEKNADPIELRIYMGANCSFTIYEDENDNYNYEKGLYSTITLQWDESSRILTIENRKGFYAGMLKERTFKIVLVNENHGTGIEPVEKADKVVKYNGKKQVIKFLRKN